MAGQEGCSSNSCLNDVTNNVENDCDEIVASSSNHEGAPLIGAGQESDAMTQHNTVLRDQLQHLRKKLRVLRYKAIVQFIYVGYYEEPKREEMEKLANGLREIGLRLVAICDEGEAKNSIISGSNESNDNDEIRIQSESIIIGQQQLQDTQMKKILGRVFIDIGRALNTYMKLRFTYQGELSVLGEKIMYRKEYYINPEKCCIFKWIQSINSGNSEKKDQPTLVNMFEDLRSMGVDLESYGTEMMQSLDSSQYILQITAPSFYNMSFIILQCLALIFYTIDVGSDVWLAIDYLNTGQMLYFGLTVSCVVIPSIITSYIAYLWSIKWESIFGFRKTDRIVIFAGAQGKGVKETSLDKNGLLGRILSAVSILMSMFYR